MYIYKITNIINGKSYIGITKDYEIRWKLHRKTCTNTHHSEYNKVLYRAIRKYGLENFLFIASTENLSVKEAKQREIELISTLRTHVTEHGYNVSPGGDLPNGNNLKGEASPNALLTNEQVKDIIAMRDSGNYTKQEVYNKYSTFIKLAGFNDIWTGRRWKEFQPKSISNPNSNIGTTRQQALEIISRRESGELQAEVYKDYVNHVTKIAFQYVWLGYRWKKLQPEKIRKRRGSLTDLQVQEIRKSKETYRTIAKKFNISVGSVSDIKNYKIYKEVPDKV